MSGGEIVLIMCGIACLLAGLTVVYWWLTSHDGTEPDSITTWEPSYDDFVRAGLDNPAKWDTMTLAQKIQARDQHWKKITS